MIKKNEYTELEIIDTTNLGAGVARHEGITVFINGGVTGDKVRAKIIKVTKNTSKTPHTACFEGTDSCEAACAVGEVLQVI